MTLNFQQVREQVQQLGETALRDQRDLEERQKQAWDLLTGDTIDPSFIRQNINDALKHDPSLRCAVPRDEPLASAIACNIQMIRGTIIAADGSQILPDRHAEVQYALINTGLVSMQLGSGEAPVISISSRLWHGEQLFLPGGMMSEPLLSLERDLIERKALAERAASAQPPVFTITDGPLELWGPKETGSEEARQYQKRLSEYLATLRSLEKSQSIPAGYVDKPGANLVVRMLETAIATPEAMQDMRNYRPLHGVSDYHLFQDLLTPGDRSAVFGIQSSPAKNYTGSLALHFFYLNVGRQDHPWLARVEIPAWVAQDNSQLNALQAGLLAQCQVLGGQPYPYLLHRAHETALVNLSEKEQVTQMIIQELYKRGIRVGEKSHKQGLKDQSGRKQ
jgi:NurA domain